MNNLKLSLIVSALLVSMLGGSQAFAKNIEVSIGKIAEGKEIIIPGYGETLDHEYECRDSHQAVYIRTNGNKIQPACANYGNLDSGVTPIEESITFFNNSVKYKDAVLDTDKNKIR